MKVFIVEFDSWFILLDELEAWLGTFITTTSKPQQLLQRHIYIFIIISINAAFVIFSVI